MLLTEETVHLASVMAIAFSVIEILGNVTVQRKALSGNTATVAMNKTTILEIQQKKVVAAIIIW